MLQCEGSRCFCNWARQRTLHGDLSLAIAYDDGGMVFKETMACSDVVECALLAGSLRILGMEVFRPVSFRRLHPFKGQSRPKILKEVS